MTGLGQPQSDPVSQLVSQVLLITGQQCHQSPALLNLITVRAGDVTSEIITVGQSSSSVN